jgi:polysaccharide export outer membrane protein
MALVTTSPATKSRHIGVFVRGAAVALLALGVASCSSLPTSGPSYSAIVDKPNESSDDIDGYTLIDVSAANIGTYRVHKANDAAGGGAAQTQAAIRLAPGDIIRVAISEGKEGGLFAPLAAGGTNFPQVRVDKSGSINLPYVGRLPVRGLDLPDVEARIRAKLQGTAFEPQVYVELLANRNNTVLVAGDVKSPGRHSLLEGPMTIVDAVAKAGGLARPALQSDVVLRRGKSVRRIAMSDVYNGHNLQLAAGDELTIEYGAKTFNALGAVKKTGQLEFTKASPTLMDGLAQAAWLNDDAANPTGIFVFRLNEPHAWRDQAGTWHRGNVVFRVDLRKPENLFLAQALALKPDDSIYVTNAPAYEWMKAVRPIAMSLLAVRNATGTASQIETLTN